MMPGVSPAPVLGSEISPEQIEQAVLGDEDASRHIIEVLHRPVFATIYRFLGRRFASEVEDIAQEVFLKLFRNLHRFDPQRGVKLTTWVFSIVRNHCFDVLKRRRITAVSLDGGRDGEDHGLEPEATEERGSSEWALNSELGRKIDDAIQSLRPQHRLVFVLREYERLDYQSIAEVTGVSEGTVKSRLHRAKAALMLKLAPYVCAPSPRT